MALELGGKSPAIVFDDANLEAAVASVVGGGFSLGGQGCVLGTRLLVQASVYDESSSGRPASPSPSSSATPLRPAP